MGSPRSMVEGRSRTPPPEPERRVGSNSHAGCPGCPAGPGSDRSVHGELLGLQRAVGNVAVQGLVVQRDVSQVLAAIGSALGGSAASILIDLGYRDETKLTNYLFWAEHPDMAGEKIQPGQKTLVRDWPRIRDEIVRPKLAAASLLSGPGGTVMVPPTMPSGGPNLDDWSLPPPGHFV